MIIFKITNTKTQQTYIGSTKGDIYSRWQEYVKAAEAGMDFPLYEDIRAHGEVSFEVEEIDFAETREEQQELELYYTIESRARSLKGYKFSTAKVVIPAAQLELQEEILAARASMQNRTAPIASSVVDDSDAEDGRAPCTEVVTPSSHAATEATAEITHDDTALVETKNAEHQQLSDSLADLLAQTAAQLPDQARASAVLNIAQQLLAIADGQNDASPSVEPEMVAEDKAQVLRNSNLAATIAALRVQQSSPKRGGKKAAATTTVSRAKQDAIIDRSSLNDGLDSSVLTTLKKAAPAAASSSSPATGDTLPTGRARSSVKEKRIREALAKEREARESERLARIEAEKSEMDAILANIAAREKDSRLTLRKRRNGR